MKKIALLCTIMIIFVGCRTQQLPPAIHETNETVRIEYREKLRDTTIYIQLPTEVIERVTPDTVSVVETSLALSVATWRNNMLWHSIENKTDSLPARVIYRDRTIVRDSIVREFISEPYLVPREFTRWQSFFMKLGVIAFCLIVAGLLIVSMRIKRRLKGS